MRRIFPLRPIGPYEMNQNWVMASVEKAKSAPRPMSEFMARYSLVRLAQEMFAKSAAEGVARLLAAAKQAQQAARRLQRLEEASVLAKRKAISSDPSAVSAKASPGAGHGSRIVHVAALAREQINSGASFARDAQTAIRPGWNEFEIRTQERTTRVPLWVEPGDANGKTLGKLQAGINRAESGVQARLATDEVGKLTLELHGERTGKSHWFTVSDVTGNAVAATGSHLVARTARDAEYRLDDGPQLTSASNKITLDSGKLTLELKRTTGDEPVRVTVASDVQAVAHQLREMTNGYNELLDMAAAASGYVSPSLLHRIRNLSPRDGLVRLGIGKDEYGKLTVDPQVLAARLEVDPQAVAAELQDPGGLPARLDKLTAKLQAAPAEALLDPHHPDFLRYANYQSTLQLYTQLPFDGVLLNRYM